MLMQTQIDAHMHIDAHTYIHIHTHTHKYTPQSLHTCIHESLPYVYAFKNETRLPIKILSIDSIQSSF